MDTLYPIVDAKTGEVAFKTTSVDKIPEVGKGQCLIVRKSDLAGLSGEALLKAYNTLAGTNVKRFASRDEGEKRFIRFLNPSNHTDEGAIMKTETASSKKTSSAPASKRKVSAKRGAAKKTSTKAKTAAASKKAAPAKKSGAATGGGGAGRRSNVNEKAKISLLVTENPKRAGSAAHDRFALYKNGMTVGTFLEKGGSSADLRYDEEHGYIKLSA